MMVAAGRSARRPGGCLPEVPGPGIFRQLTRPGQRRHRRRFFRQLTPPAPRLSVGRFFRQLVPATTAGFFRQRQGRCQAGPVLPAGRLIPFSAAVLAVLAAVLAVILPAGTAPAASRPAAETRVWAFPPVAPVGVRVTEPVSADQRLGEPATCPKCVQGACAATEGAAGAGDDIPTVVFSRSRAPGIAGNFDDAVSNGAPTQLTRVSAAARDANRAAALRGLPPAPAGQSLDEYPFACSAEGGCGAFVRAVPAGEQSYQGGVLSSFFQRFAITAGDPFNVSFGP
jgi:hypothetical protein